MIELIAILFSAAITENLILTRFLGICPFLGVSKKTKNAIGMGIAVTFVMLIATLITWPIHYYILIEYSIEFMRYVVFILVIATLVQFLEMYLRRFNQRLFEAFGIYLTLITTNCAILGLVLLSILNEYSFGESIVFALGSGLGFIIALFIMSGIRERLEVSEIPESFKGIPITLIIAGILALIFSGLRGVL